MMRNFFYAAAGEFLLALAFHLGSTTATAQGTGQFVSITSSSNGGGYAAWALTSDGRVYVKYGGSNNWSYEGSITGGAPVPATQQSWGQVKARYR